MAVALPAPTVRDPIFAVIDRDRTAYTAWLHALEEGMTLEDELPDDRRQSKSHAGELTIVETDDPRWIANLRKYEQTWAEEDAATVAMTNTTPTTMVGVMALLECIDQFNRGKLRLENRVLCGSEHPQWPDDLEDVDVKDQFGRSLEMPWPFWIMRNVQAALQSLA